VWWNITDFADPADDPTAEIVRVTGRTGDSLTVTRGQEGTSAATHNSGSKVYKMALCLTKKMIDDIEAVTTGLIKCAFKARLSSSQSLPTSLTRLLLHEISDTGECYDNDNHRFLAPTNGYYFFSACVEAICEANKVMKGQILRNSTAIVEANSGEAAVSTVHRVSMFDMTYLDAGDEVAVWVSHDNASNISAEDNVGRTNFIGFCVYNGS
jgi:hypothetical protein